MRINVLVRPETACTFPSERSWSVADIDWQQIPEYHDAVGYLFKEPASIEEADERITQVREWWAAVETALDELNMKNRGEPMPGPARSFRGHRIANLHWCRFELAELYLWLLTQKSELGKALLDFVHVVDEENGNDPFESEEWEDLQRFVPDPFVGRRQREPRIF